MKNIIFLITLVISSLRLASGLPFGEAQVEVNKLVNMPPFTSMVKQQKLCMKV